MHLPGLKLMLLIMLTASGLMAQEPCIDRFGVKMSYFGMDGFFIREKEGERTFLNFAGMHVGCFAGGILDDKNNCNYQSFGKFDFKPSRNELTMSEEGKSLTFKVESIDCRALILLPLSDNKPSGTALTFNRADDFPGKFNRCFEICGEARKWEGRKGFDFYYHVVKSYLPYITLYIGTLVVLFLFGLNFRFLSFMFIHWLVLGGCGVILNYLCGGGVAITRSLYYLCGSPSENHFFLSFYRLSGYWESEISLYPSSTGGYWLIGFLAQSVFVFPSSVWLAWKFTIGRFDFGPTWVGKLLGWVFSPAYVLIAPVGFIVIALGTISSLAFFVTGYAPWTWPLALISLIFFVKIYWRVILLPWIKSDYEKIIKQFIKK